jgi:hypothetical protein
MKLNKRWQNTEMKVSKTVMSKLKIQNKEIEENYQLIEKGNPIMVNQYGLDHSNKLIEAK